MYHLSLIHISFQDVIQPSYPRSTALSIHLSPKDFIVYADPPSVLCDLTIVFAEVLRIIGCHHASEVIYVLLISYSPFIVFLNQALNKSDMFSFKNLLSVSCFFF